MTEGGPRPKVLVVDDDPALRQLLEDILVNDGFDVLQAASGARLTEMVREHQPDLVVLDEVMEPVSGLEALQSLRSSGAKVPVVMLTAIPPDDILETAVDTGADDYVAKPFSGAVLLAHLKAILRRSRWQAGEQGA